MKRNLMTYSLLGMIVISATAMVIVGQQHAFINANAAAQSPNSSNQTRTLSVTGMASTNVTPDRLSISFAVEAQAKTAQAAIQENANSATNVIQALKQAGLNDSEISTSQYSLSPVYDYVNESGKCIQYNDGDMVQKYCPPPTMRQVLVGYKAINGILIDSAQLEKAGQLVDAAVQAGANRIDYLYFKVSEQKQSELRNEMLAQAVQDAQSKANTALMPLGMTVVNVLDVNVDSFPIYPQRGYDYSGAASGGAVTPVNPGTQQVSSTVHVTFEIGGFNGRSSSDASISTSINNTFHITLDSNPSTGYHWQIKTIDNTIVKLQNDEYIAPDSGLVGASGKQILTFEGLREGSTTIVLEYVRPWEPQAPANTYTIDLTVQP